MIWKKNELSDVIEFLCQHWSFLADDEMLVKAYADALGDIPHYQVLNALRAQALQGNLPSPQDLAMATRGRVSNDETRRLELREEFSRLTSKRAKVEFRGNVWLIGFEGLETPSQSPREVILCGSLSTYDLEWIVGHVFYDKLDINPEPEKISFQQFMEEVRAGKVEGMDVERLEVLKKFAKPQDLPEPVEVDTSDVPF